MAEAIPFITSEDAARLVPGIYTDAEIVRVPLDRAANLLQALGSSRKVWLDAGVDGLHDLNLRRRQASTRNNPWFDLICSCANYEKIGTAPYQASSTEIDEFVISLLDKCIQHKPFWLTVPQIPIKGTDRNKINRSLAAATRRWKSKRGFAGKLILPLVFTHQNQLSGRTARKPRIQQAERCYHEAGADGVWVVDSALADDCGRSTVRKRLRSVIDLHTELNERISSKIRVAGPYWGLNLILWAKGLVDHPAIGVGSGYQFLLAGGPVSPSSPKVALSPLRRRVGVAPSLKGWLDRATEKLTASHPAHAELAETARQLGFLRERDRAREQVAEFYKRWFDLIARVPKFGRSMALFQDLSASYALGKSLPLLDNEGTARRPEAVAEPLMLSCL